MKPLLLGPPVQLDDEAERVLWAKMQALRQCFLYANCAPVLRGKKLSLQNKAELAGQAVGVVQGIIHFLLSRGISFENADPAHGAGHLARDFLGALRLALGKPAPITPGELFVGVLGGALHDIGCLVGFRYRDADMLLGHAEMGALLLQEAFASKSFGLDGVEQLCLGYAVAAHTHYLRLRKVTGAGGRTYVLEPYPDSFNEDQPMWFVWLTRWADRLELLCPPYVGRHWLTMFASHQDFDQRAGFYEKSFGEHMRPTLKDSQGRPTMLGRFSMLCDAKQNQPYNRLDSRVMVGLRESNSQRMAKIITAVFGGGQEIGNGREEKILLAWELFLGGNVEPTEIGRQAAATLIGNFRALSQKTRRPWLAGFACAMREYILWAQETLAFMGGLNEKWLALPGVSNDLREIIRPKKEWVDLLRV